MAAEDMLAESDILYSWEDMETASLDDLIDISPNPIMRKKLVEEPPLYSNTLYDTSVVPGVVIPLERMKSDNLGKSLQNGKTENLDKTMVGCDDLPNSEEDFNTYLARAGGINVERLTKLVGSPSPRNDEDFVSYLARSNDIKDEETICKLRQALKWEPFDPFPKKLQCHVKSEDQTFNNNDLVVGEDEDAVSFFVRTGSWEPTSSVSEELASAGLDEDEDAESYLRRTGNLGDENINIFEFEQLGRTPSCTCSQSSLSSVKEEDTIEEEVLETVNTDPKPSTPPDSRTSVKRKSSDVESCPS